MIRCECLCILHSRNRQTQNADEIIFESQGLGDSNDMKFCIIPTPTLRGKDLAVDVMLELELEPLGFYQNGDSRDNNFSSPNHNECNRRN